MTHLDSNHNLLACSIVLVFLLLLSHMQLIESFKIKNVEYRTCNTLSCMPLFNMSIAQHVSSYFAVIRCIKIDDEIASRECLTCLCCVI
jgi:hypothetical protein